MRYGKWLIAAATGASLTAFSASGLAQTRTGAKDAVVPRAAAKARAAEEVDADASTKVGTRREARRIPVIDATAGSTFRSTQLIGTSINDADGRNIGKVVDFVSDARGNILYQIVSYSGSPGFSGKLFAIPTTGLSFSAGENNTTTAQFTFDPTLLKNAPSFSSLRFPDFSDPAFVSEISTFYADLLANGASRTTATDPTVPANGPGDRVQTQAQANTPTRPIDPTLPANGPGDRPATVNPALPTTGTPPAATTPDSRIPGTTGTENAGFPPATNRSIVGRTGSPASSTLPGGTIVGRTGSPASSAIPGSAAAEAAAAAGVESDASVSSSTAGLDSRMMLRSSQMMGMTIQDNQGKSIGKVVDFVGDTNGSSQFAIVSLGGDRNIVLPFNGLSFQAGANGTSFASLRVTPSQLKNAPSFTGNQWPNFTDAKFIGQVSEFYSDLLPTAGASRGYDYGKFPTTSPDGTMFPRGGAPRTGAAPGATPPGTAAPAPGTKLPQPGTSRGYDYGKFPKTSPDGTMFPRGTKPGAAAPRPGAGPRLPAPGAGAPGVPGVPSLPGKPGAAPGAPAPGGAAPGSSGS